MIKIDKPNIQYYKVFDLCIGSLRQGKLKSLLIDNRSKFIKASAKFNELGELHKLGMFQDHSHRVISTQEEKKEVINLYEKFKKNKPVSNFYNKLKLSSRRCVYCNRGFTKTLDHYLPKAKFPLISIEPANLIPCCYDCNSTLNTLSQQRNSHLNPLLIHPYFNNNDYIYDEQWIFGDIPIDQPFFDKTKPNFNNLTLTFYTDFKNTNIDRALHPSLNFQFDNLMLNSYVDTAIEIIPTELTRLRRYKGSGNQLISNNKNYLLNRAYIHNGVNSAPFVIYQTLANSQLYLETIEKEFF